jgi:hypothetical protein
MLLVLTGCFFMQRRFAAQQSYFPEGRGLRMGDAREVAGKTGVAEWRRGFGTFLAREGMKADENSFSIDPAPVRRGEFHRAFPCLAISKHSTWRASRLT